MAEVTGSPGQVLADRYRLVALLGRGGMGSVWRAEHLSLGTPVAIKLVHPSVAERPGTLARFLREAQAAARLRSVNVVQILDHGVHEGVPYIAMECLVGESLTARLARERKLSPAATGLVVAGVCRALAAAHRAGIVHRDLKPDNIFIAEDEAGPIVKVLDFGIAKVLEAESEASHQTETGTMLGTPRYMSPEQARAKRDLDGRADLWSLAVIAFQCLTGRLPFDADVLSALVLQICTDPVPAPSSIAEVPPGFDAWIARAMQRDPDARFQTAREFADTLADVLTPGQRWLETLDEKAAGGPPTRDPDALARPAATADRPADTGASLVKTGSTPASRPRRFLLGAGALAVVVAAGFLAVAKAPRTGSAVAASAEAPPAALAPSVVSAASSVASASATASAPVLVVAEQMRRVNLVVLPSNASVEVDGAAARSRDGVVEIAGKLGSVHKVRVWKGKLELEGEVSVTDSGALPPKMDLGSARAKAPPKATRVDNFDE